LGEALRRERCEGTAAVTGAELELEEVLRKAAAFSARETDR